MAIHNKLFALSFLLAVILTPLYHNLHTLAHPIRRDAGSVDTLSNIAAQKSHLSDVEQAQKHTDKSVFLVQSDLEVASRVLALLPHTYALDLTQDYTLKVASGRKETDEAELSAHLRNANDIHAINAALGPHHSIDTLHHAMQGDSADLQGQAHRLELEAFLETIVVHEEVVLIQNTCEYEAEVPVGKAECNKGQMLELHSLEFWRESEYAKIVADSSQIKAVTHNNDAVKNEVNGYAGY